MRGPQLFSCQDRRMAVVFVTGEIGAGKSSFCAALRDLGADVISADDIVSDVYENQPDVLARIEQSLGARVRHPNGSLDREALANLIFSSPDKRRAVEAIVHPKVSEVLLSHLNASTAPVTVYDVPIVRQRSGVADVMVNVVAPESVRLERLVSRGMSADDAKARITTQADDKTRVQDFDVIIENVGSPEELKQRAQQLFSEWAS
jgi:dephospho-CoA kinase